MFEIMEKPKILVNVPVVYMPHKKQREFHTCDAKFKAFVGGIGSGKTIAGSAEALEISMSQPRLIGVVLAPTFPQLRDATMMTFFDICPPELIKEHNKMEHKVVLMNDSIILFRSGLYPENLKGTNIDWFWIDEGALTKPLLWSIMIGRIRRGRIDKGWVTTTPKGYNWIYEKFFEQKKGSYEYVLCTTFENPHLTKDYLDEVSKDYGGLFARQELYAEFVSFEGLVYPDFSLQRHLITKTPDIQTIKSLIAGVDWGFTNPAAIVFVGLDNDNRAYVLGEIYIKRQNIENLISLIKHRESIFFERYKLKPSTYYCDPSEPMFIEEFQKNGLRAAKADNEVVAGIGEVTRRLMDQGDGKPALFVHEECTNLTREFGQYRYPDPKENKPEKEQPLKVNDHAVDSLRYAMMGISKKSTVDFLVR